MAWRLDLFGFGDDLGVGFERGFILEHGTDLVSGPSAREAT
jgi:hypothetical protein